MGGWGGDPLGGQHRCRGGGALLLRPALLGGRVRLRPVRDLLVLTDPVRPILAVPHRLLRLRNAPDDGRRLGPQGWLGIRPWGPAPVVRGAREGVAHPPARRAAAQRDDTPSTA